MDISLADYKDRLLDEKRQIESMIKATEGNISAVTLDQTKVGRLSRMDALQSQAMSREVDRRRQLELKRIDAALARIEAGEFGYCITCGEDIEPARLKHNPSLPQCGACASGQRK